MIWTCQLDSGQGGQQQNSTKHSAKNTKDINGHPSLKCMLQALLSLTCWPNQHDAWSFQGPKTVYISSTFSGLSKKETHSGTHDKCSTLLQSQCWCLSPVMAGSMDIENGLDRNAQESAEDLKCGTETKSASQAIVGFSMAILAGPPTWYHMMLFCCSYCGTCVSVLWYCSETREAQDRNDTLQWFAEKVFCLAQPSTCQWTSRTVYSVKITANTSWTLQKTSFLSFFSREVLFFPATRDFHFLCCGLRSWDTRFCRGLMKMIIWNMVKSSLLRWRWFVLAERGGLKVQLDFRKK